MNHVLFRCEKSPFINNDKQKSISISCPYCYRNFNKNYNYERHIFRNHYNQIESLVNIAPSIINNEKKKKSGLNKVKNLIDDISLKKHGKIKVLLKPLSFKECTSNKFYTMLKNVFNKSNNLNRDNEDMGSFYINEKKIIGKGSFTTTYLGEDKLTKFYVAILKTDMIFEDDLILEEYILQKIHGKGNFPNLYKTLINDKYKYFVESLMGPTLKLLFTMCDKYFDFNTKFNIGIDLISNIKIIHDLGFLHNDLKPDNIVFGTLCFENYQNRNRIGIIDFSRGKLIINQNCKLNYKNTKVKCRGNLRFASTNALYDRDTTKKDDIISIFLILIYFNNGYLPWEKDKNNNINLTKQEIINMRKKIKIKDLCVKFPDEFVTIFESVINMDNEAEPQYELILKVFNYLISEEKKNLNYNQRFIWINILKNFCNKNSNISKEKEKLISSFLSQYSLNIKEYIEYITSK